MKCAIRPGGLYKFPIHDMYVWEHPVNKRHDHTMYANHIFMVIDQADWNPDWTLILYDGEKQGWIHIQNQVVREISGDSYE